MIQNTVVEPGTAAVPEIQRICAMKLNSQRPLLRACGFATLLLAPLATRAQGASAPAPASTDEAVYMMGLNLGQQLRQNGVTAGVPLNRIEQGVKDGLAGKRALGPDQMRLQAFLAASVEAATARNTAAARAYLQDNAKASGVASTASGLQYKVIEQGDPKAASPRPTDMVTVSFRGRLIDGTEFDSSSKPGTATTVQVNGVMKGWTEALTLMKPGAHWQLFVPPELGYGAATRLGVPGGSLLIYDFRLLSISTPQIPAEAAVSPSK